MSECQPKDSQTEVQTLKLEIEALKQRIQEAQRMTALGELVSTTTHEFNNVLMTIINYAKMGLRHEDEQTRTKSFDKILTAGHRAAKITNSVLGMARNRKHQFDLTNIENLIDETMILLEREMQKYRISVEIDVADNVPEVPAIGNQIQQVFLNLLINARQAMNDGGRLVVRLQKDEKTQTVDLSVRDYGIGMTQDQLRQIFKPYFSTKDGPDESGKGGTGLGLSACRSIIESHGGKIRVESSPGKGTCFTIKLPINRTPAPASRGIAGAVAQINTTVPAPTAQV